MIIILYRLELIVEVEDLQDVDTFLRRIYDCNSAYDFWEGNSEGYMSPEEEKEFFIDSELDERVDKNGN